jgi:polyhydroxyalkanoate synthesis repressor PhaR
LHRKIDRAMTDLHPDSTPITIRKYANRRLYNTSSGEFVTLDNLRQMVQENKNFKVVDAKSDQDITTSVLAQIIAEQEGRGENVLPDDILRQVIRFYEQGLTENYSNFLRQSIDAFNTNADQLEAMSKAGLANIETFQKSMAAMFGYTPPRSDPTPQEEESSSDLDLLKKQMREMQEKLDRLSPKS